MPANHRNASEHQQVAVTGGRDTPGHDEGGSELWGGHVPKPTTSNVYRSPLDQKLVEFDTTTVMTPVRRRAMFLIALGEFLDGYDLISIAGALLLLRPQFDMTPSQTGLLGASAFFGAAIGLLVAGAAADRIGRRVVFVYNFWLFAALSIVSALVTGYTQLLIVRVLLGVAIGADIATSMTFLGEISPRHSRGAWTGALPQMAWTFGALVSLAVALVFIDIFGAQAWRWLFGVGAIPAIIILLGRRTLPESPRWLLSHGRTQEAEAAMRAFGLTMSPVETSNVLQQSRPAYQESRGSYLDIFRAPYTRQAWLAIIIVGFTPLVGASASVAGPYVLHFVGLLGQTAALKAGMLIWTGGLVGSTIALLTIDRIGRIWSSVISCWGCALCMILLVVFGTDPGCIRHRLYVVWRVHLVWRVFILGSANRTPADPFAGPGAGHRQRARPLYGWYHHLDHPDRNCDNRLHRHIRLSQPVRCDHRSLCPDRTAIRAQGKRFA